MRALLAALIVAVLFGANVWLYRSNKKTPVPEGCENLRPECGSCGIKDCAMRGQLMTERKEDNHGNL